MSIQDKTTFNVACPEPLIAIGRQLAIATGYTGQFEADTFKQSLQYQDAEGNLYDFASGQGTVQYPGKATADQATMEALCNQFGADLAMVLEAQSKLVAWLDYDPVTGESLRDPETGEWLAEPPQAQPDKIVAHVNRVVRPGNAEAALERMGLVKLRDSLYDLEV